MDFGSIWDGVSNFATTAFNWIGDHPEASNLIGGVVMGAAQGYMANQQMQDERDFMQKQARQERAFQKDQWERERESRYAKPGEIGDYGTHLNQIGTGGLITNGQIAERV